MFSSTSTSTSNPIKVSMGDRSLALYVSGPEPSTSRDPIVLFVSGVASSSLNWAGVVRHVPPTLHCYTYDRAGYRNSNISPDPPTAENNARDLFSLITNAHIQNPLILVGHSWAGVLINEFITLAGNNGPQIAGLVLIDANHESMPEVLNVNDPDLRAVSEGVNPYLAKGTAAEHKLTREEWDR
ncbi:putative alpha/beta hydrolase [Stemphylium lycopersici]|nr:putative alpha/beta hydrolase [Stemphylium lycopersici]